MAWILDYAMKMTTTNHTDRRPDPCSNQLVPPTLPFATPLAPPFALPDMISDVISDVSLQEGYLTRIHGVETISESFVPLSKI